MEENTQMKDDKKYWYGLVILGIFALLNALYSTLMRPENPVPYENINVRWINTIILLAGISPILFLQKTINSETAIVVTNVISLCICASCAISDLGSLIIAVFGKTYSNTVLSNFINEDEIDTRNNTVIYNSLDLVICVLAGCFSYKLISNRFNSSPSLHMVDSRRLQGYGVALIILTMLGIFNHAWQRLVMVHHKLGRVLDMNTIDEFSWLVINLATGILVFLSSRANQLIQTTSFVLSGATIYPSFFYSWLDYRVMTSTHSRFLFKQAILSLSISIPHIGVLLAVFFMFMLTIRDRIQVNIQKMHKIILAAFSLFFLLIAVSLVDVNFYALFTKQFYRVFHSSEQKLPFLTAFLSLFTGLSVITKFNYICLAASLIIGILSVNATFLHIFSYLYLRWNGYFIDGTNIDFIIFPADKFDNGTETSMVHTVETSLNCISLIGSFCLVTFLMFVSRSHTTPTEIVENNEQNLIKKSHERRILMLGVMMLILSLIVLFLAFYIFITSTEIHPLVTIYSQIFHIVLGISITTFALFQVLVSENLSKYPLFSTALLMLSVIRSLDILTQIDYKDVRNQPFIWTIHALVEYFSMFAHFLTIASILYVQGEGREFIEPADIPMNFENPIATDENGYIMLRTNENGE